VALLGTCQVGKTTLAIAIGESLENGAIYLYLELPSDRESAMVKSCQVIQWLAEVGKAGLLKTS
jgi:DNA replication protein DnaC